MKPLGILKLHLKTIKISNLTYSDNCYEFHISKSAREKYKFEQKLFSLTGNTIFADYYSVRLFASKINKHRDLVNFPENAVKAGQINAMGLIDEILHYVVSLYKQDKNKNVFRESLDLLKSELGEQNVINTLTQFLEEFPSMPVYKKELTIENYLSKEGIQELILEEILNLYLANNNPAFGKYGELFDDMNLAKFSDYRNFISILKEYFNKQIPFGPENQNLIDMLQAPAKASPHSLSGQLEYIRKHWGLLLSKYMMKLYGSVDLIKEENKPIFDGPGPTLVPDFIKSGIDTYDEPERFSNDLEWMPNVVMIAKSTYVWLDQLSKKYKKDIYRLDHIPDEELDILASRGFTALWLIGLWERSPASKQIKQIMGNPEAVSSAYSLFDYIIANDLGGESAYNDLRHRAWQRGIRLASDMVPNHTGIFSKWIIEHPDWFVQLDHPPFPNYSFNGQNLSNDDRVSVFIEDGYWNHSDAAVVFKRVDNFTGDTKYIFHGNDGTSMPWNDTAQLNYLKQEVRESVIQTILHVARRFPIIRFDAAMTLAKKHFQRLWFPQPGTGGDIPSRSENAITREQFDEIFPVEFWREVVDRVAQEVPDTLLLAEAFWMMEGYFVRTLGMHRVYNSAFMNMLKNEENEKYRQSIKNVMDFNPGILKRFVNFLNNPDEDTAIAQFGKDDKYFGVCTIMITMPGLPMFGHGQVEGFAEKYGMEYRRAYWDEQEDQYLIEKHNREIFPLLKKRYLFSGVENFVLFDLVSTDGSVNENVYAYSNGIGDERALILYNNKFQEARGRIHFSSVTAQKDNGNSKQISVAQALQLVPDEKYYCIFKDQISGLEFIRNQKLFHEEGFYNELDAFKYQVLMDFRQIRDNEFNHYRDLANHLNGRGVPDMQEALQETFLVPIHYPFKEIINTGFLNFAYDNLSDTNKWKNVQQEFKKKYSNLIYEIIRYQKLNLDPEKNISDTIKNFNNIFVYFNSGFVIDKKDFKDNLSIFVCWIIIFNISKLFESKDSSVQSIALLDDWLFGKIINHLFYDINNNESESAKKYLLLKILLLFPDWMIKAEKKLTQSVNSLFSNQHVSRFLQLNRYQEILFLNAESLSELVLAFYHITAIDQDITEKDFTKTSNQFVKTIKKINSTAKASGYRVSELLETIEN